MAADTILSLTVEHLRGSTVPFSLNFEKGKKLTVIYGENGTGKSTICDAFDFLGKGNVGSLDGRGLGKTNKYWHSIGMSASDVAVKLKTSAGECKATLARTGVIVDPLERRPRVEVLRRGQILRLLEAKPADRYAAISDFIDVSGIEDSETALRGLIRDIQSDLEIAIARIEENRNNIGSFWFQAGKPGGDSLAWAESEIQKDQSEAEQAKLAVDELKTMLARLVEYPEQFKNKISEVDGANGMLDQAQERVNTLRSDASNEYLEILDILRSAQHYFEKHSQPDACPLCESRENVSDLAQKVNARIAAQGVATELKNAEQNLSSQQRTVELKEQSLADLHSRAMDDAQKYVNAARDPRLPTAMGEVNISYPAELSKWGEWLSFAPQLSAKLDTLSSQLSESKRFIGVLKDAVAALKTNSEARRDLEVVVPRLKKVLEIVEEQRKKFTDSVLQKIANDVGRMYEVVHPGEGLNKISLELDPAKRASLEIASDFRGLKDAPPQAYFSDSHLDTLGLCVFLALAQMDKPGDTILVLDDVLGSVDEPHVDRLIEMLFQEATKFKQCVITTHYGPWRQKLRWGWIKNGQCQFVELAKWNSQKGISLIRSIPDVDRLRSLLAESPPDPQLICAKAGVVLEATLDFLTLLYECHVPRKVEARYTLGELLPAIDKKLRTSLKVEHKEEDEDENVVYIEKFLAPHLDELARIAQVRNVFGCHFNSISFELLDSDAIRFGAEVLALIDALVDHEAGWPRNNKSGSYWATSGETRRLHPLVRPN